MTVFKNSSLMTRNFWIQGQALIRKKVQSERKLDL